MLFKRAIKNCLKNMLFGKFDDCYDEMVKYFCCVVVDALDLTLASECLERLSMMRIEKW